jgi:hypothetical protein
MQRPLRISCNNSKELMETPVEAPHDGLQVDEDTPMGIVNFKNFTLQIVQPSPFPLQD